MTPKIKQPGSNGDELETRACSQKMEENNILHRTNVRATTLLEICI